MYKVTFNFTDYNATSTVDAEGAYADSMWVTFTDISGRTVAIYRAESVTSVVKVAK